MQPTHLQELVNFIYEKFHEYKQDRKKELKENIRNLSKRLDDLDSVIERQE